MRTARKLDFDPAVRDAVLDELRGAAVGVLNATLTRDDLVSLAWERVGQARGWSRSTTARRVREALVALEAEGVPVVSTGKGFRLSDSQAEADAAARRLERQGLSILARAASIRRITLGQVLRQLALPLDHEEAASA